MKKGSVRDFSASDTPRIDAFDCSRRGLEYAGEVPLSNFARFTEDLPVQHGSVRWRLSGATGPLGEALLRLHVQADPVVVCQRCLETFEAPLESETVLQLVSSQAELDADDTPPDEVLDEGYDKVLGSSHFSILEQVEDELILAMPYIARHQACSPDVSDADDAPGAPQPEPERRNPFAVLDELREQLKKD